MRKILAILSAGFIIALGLAASTTSAQADGSTDEATWTVECGQVTFTNISEENVLLPLHYDLPGAINTVMIYLVRDQPKTIVTDKDSIIFSFGHDRDGPYAEQIPQNCDDDTGDDETGASTSGKQDANAVPRVAPAAGI